MEVSWSVAIDYEEVRTIDSYMPWELVPGQAKVKMSMRRIITPDRSLAGDGLFTTITSVLHTPYASVELRDRLGNLVFFAKGSFTDIQGQVANGQMGVASLSFIGYYWRENVKQEFDPQPADNSVMGKIKTTNSLYGRIKGGL